jgi:ferritin
MSTYAKLLQEQIRNEFTAAQQYTAVAVWYDDQDLPRLAGHFYKQALEERNHAMMMVRYLLDAGEEPIIPGVAAPTTTFADVVEPVKLALEQEKKVSGQIGELARVAREESDFLSEQFVQWFLKEQVEEVATMSDLLRVVERSRENPMWAEEYLARERASGAPADPTAPPVAGGAV